LSSCLETQGIPSIGLVNAHTVVEGGMASGGMVDTITYFLFDPIQINCENFVQFIVESDTNPCGIAISKIAVLHFSNIAEIINILIASFILLSITNIFKR